MARDRAQGRQPHLLDRAASDRLRHRSRRAARHHDGPSRGQRRRQIHPDAGAGGHQARDEGSRGGRRQGPLPPPPAGTGAADGLRRSGGGRPRGPLALRDGRPRAAAAPDALAGRRLQRETHRRRVPGDGGIGAPGRPALRAPLRRRTAPRHARQRPGAGHRPAAARRTHQPSRRAPPAAPAADHARHRPHHRRLDPRPRPGHGLVRPDRDARRRGGSMLPGRPKKS